MRPPDTLDDWDEAAEAVHGISRALLEAQGVPPPRAFQQLDHACRSGGGLAVADGDAWDRLWLRRLCAAAGVPEPSCDANGDSLLDGWRLRSFCRLLASVSGSLSNSRQALETADQAPRQHRAEADARRLAETLLEARRLRSANGR